MTAEQLVWLAKRENWQPVGRPRSGISFAEWGTLYEDGTYEKSEHLKPIKLRPGCIGVGRTFYGAECPSYPDCTGGCGLGCTHEIEEEKRRSSATEDGQ